MIIHRLSSRRTCAFTLVELIMVLIIIMILASLIIPAMSYIRARVEKASCISNLRNLHTAMANHLTDHRRWPQIPVDATRVNDSAEAWIKTMEPYGLAHENWICPTVQRNSGGADFTQPEHYRIDYRASYFDPHPTSPTRWATQPWFLETGDNHGGGNLLIFQDGTITNLNDVRRESN